MKMEKKLARKGLQKENNLGILSNVKKTPYISSVDAAR